MNLATKKRRKCWWCGKPIAAGGGGAMWLPTDAPQYTMGQRLWVTSCQVVYEAGPLMSSLYDLDLSCCW